MSADSKRNGGGSAVAPPLMSSSDDRKSSSGSSPGKKVIIKSADMKEDVQKEAIEIAVAAFEKNNVEKDVAEHIKKMFDQKYGPTWHCIVGKNFEVLSNLMTSSSMFPSFKMNQITFEQRSYVTHETNHFVYFYLDSKAVLLFKSG